MSEETFLVILSNQKRLQFPFFVTTPLPAVTRSQKNRERLRKKSSGLLFGQTLSCKHILNDKKNALLAFP